VLCDVGADVAYRFLADPEKLGTWALGCWEARLVDEDEVRGRSLFDGTQTTVRLARAEEARLVDFAVGGHGEEPVPRISARVIPGDVLGRAQGQCLVTLLAYRTAEMTPERWSRLEETHDAEVLLLKARIEAAP
jgi:hypothetical protein